MKLQLEKITSSQRWAIGAVALAVLIACSPQAPEEPAQPKPSEPTLHTSGTEAPDTTAGTTAAEAAQLVAPGFAGDWASAEAECADPAKMLKLSADRIEMTPSAQSCSVKSISEEHPTGRSMIYTISADCLAGGKTSADNFTLNFGPSDTVMQLQLNDRQPMRLVRCP
ncbi:MAG: hypothetical protein Q8R02_19655 [Hyphomonadaceae bacterium]|nr:hypothetical protein [Hyphomonadaceae bacterium]